jgi:ATP-dependent Lon protease
VIQLSGYTHDEKLHIACRFLLPKQVAQNGLSDAHVQVTEPALLSIATQYTREAGVRALERAIGGVVRFKAVEWAAHVDARGLSPSSAPSPVSSLPSSRTVADTDATGGSGKSARLVDAGYDPVVEADELEKILGLSQHDREDRDREAKRGVVWGLVVTGMGEGELMPIESIATPGNGNLKLTGSLGDVRFSFPMELATLFLRFAGVCLGYQRERGARAQLGQDTRVRPWHHQ